MASFSRNETDLRVKDTGWVWWSRSQDFLAVKFAGEHVMFLTVLAGSVLSFRFETSAYEKQS